MRSLIGNSAISALCENLNRSKQYLVQTTLLYRSPMPAASAPWWYVELAALPGMALNKANNCSEYSEMLVVAPKLEPSADKLSDATEAWIGRIIKARLKVYADEYKKVSSTSKSRETMWMPEIHSRLDRLKRCGTTAGTC
jgi:hypothetical protein